MAGFTKKQNLFSGVWKMVTKDHCNSFMKVRWMAWVIIGCLWCYYVVVAFGNLKSELAPMEDKSNIRFTVTGAEGTSYNYMQRLQIISPIICMILFRNVILFLPVHQVVEAVVAEY